MTWQYLYCIFWQRGLLFGHMRFTLFSAFVMLLLSDTAEIKTKTTPPPGREIVHRSKEQTETVEKECNW